jgi:hypothetical protein
MAVSQEDLDEDRIITEDFIKAHQVLERILKNLKINIVEDDTATVFALCLIYARLLGQNKS